MMTFFIRLFYNHRTWFYPFKAVISLTVYNPFDFRRRYRISSKHGFKEFTRLDLIVSLLIDLVDHILIVFVKVKHIVIYWVLNFDIARFASNSLFQIRLGIRVERYFLDKVSLVDPEDRALISLTPSCLSVFITFSHSIIKSKEHAFTQNVQIACEFLHFSEMHRGLSSLCFRPDVVLNLYSSISPQYCLFHLFEFSIQNQIHFVTVLSLLIHDIILEEHLLFPLILELVQRWLRPVLELRTRLEKLYLLFDLSPLHLANAGDVIRLGQNTKETVL